MATMRESMSSVGIQACEGETYTAVVFDGGCVEAGGAPAAELRSHITKAKETAIARFTTLTPFQRTLTEK